MPTPGSPGSAEWPRPLVWTICTLTLAAFIPVLVSGFLSDDFVVVEFVRRHGHSPFAWPDRLPAQVFRPLGMLIFSVQGLVFGNGAILYHAIGILMHALNAWL